MSMEASYYKALRDAVRQLFKAMTDTVMASSLVRKDSIHTDALGDEIARLFGPLEARWGAKAQELMPVVERVAGRINDFDYANHQRAVKAVVAVNVIQAEPWLQDELSYFGRENAKLIKDIGQTAIDRVERLVEEHVRTGKSTKALASLLREELGIAERRSAVIARDQVGKLNGRLTEMRQKNLGIETYRWRGVLDKRERHSHRDREGNIYRWDSPPGDGHPGQPILCRCVAEPVMDEFEDLLSKENPADWKGIDKEVIPGRRPPYGPYKPAAAAPGGQYKGKAPSHTAPWEADLESSDPLRRARAQESVKYMRRLQEMLAKQEKAIDDLAIQTAKSLLSAKVAQQAAAEATAEAQAAMQAVSEAEGIKLDAAPTVEEAMALLVVAKEELAKAVAESQLAQQAAAQATAAAAAGDSTGLAAATQAALAAEAKASAASQKAIEAANQVKKAKANAASKASKAKAKLAKGGAPEPTPVAPAPSPAVVPSVQAPALKVVPGPTVAAVNQVANPVLQKMLEELASIPEVPPLAPGATPDQVDAWKKLKANVASKKSKLKAKIKAMEESAPAPSTQSLTSLEAKAASEAELTTVEMKAPALGQLTESVASKELALAEAKAAENLSDLKARTLANAAEEAKLAKATPQGQASIGSTAKAAEQAPGQAAPPAVQGQGGGGVGAGFDLTTARQFPTKQALDKWADAAYPKGGLSQADKAATVRYQDPTAYKVINSGLRGNNNLGLKNSSGAIMTPEEMVAKEQSTIKRLDDLLNRHKSTESFVTYRGCHGQAVIDQLIEAANTGKAYRDNAFLSTTPMKHVADNFSKAKTASGVPSAFIEMRVPPGTPSFYVNQVKDIGEAEILLGRGLDYKVVSHKIENGRHHFVMEVIPPTESKLAKAKEWLERTVNAQSAPAPVAAPVTSASIKVGQVGTHTPSPASHVLQAAQQAQEAKVAQAIMSNKPTLPLPAEDLEALKKAKANEASKKSKLKATEIGGKKFGDYQKMSPDEQLQFASGLAKPEYDKLVAAEKKWNDLTTGSATPAPKPVVTAPVNTIQAATPTPHKFGPQGLTIEEFVKLPETEQTAYFIKLSDADKQYVGANIAKAKQGLAPAAMPSPALAPVSTPVPTPTPTPVVAPAPASQSAFQWTGPKGNGVLEPEITLNGHPKVPGTSVTYAVFENLSEAAKKITVKGMTDEQLDLHIKLSEAYKMGGLDELKKHVKDTNVVAPVPAISTTSKVYGPKGLTLEEIDALPLPDKIAYEKAMPWTEFSEYHQAKTIAVTTQSKAAAANLPTATPAPTPAPSMPSSKSKIEDYLSQPDTSSKIKFLNSFPYQEKVVLYKHIQPLENMLKKKVITGVSLKDWLAMTDVEKAAITGAKKTKLYEAQQAYEKAVEAAKDDLAKASTSVPASAPTPVPTTPAPAVTVASLEAQSINSVGYKFGEYLKLSDIDKGKVKGNLNVTQLQALKKLETEHAALTAQAPGVVLSKGTGKPLDPAVVAKLEESAAKTFGPQKLTVGQITALPQVEKDAYYKLLSSSQKIEINMIKSEYNAAHGLNAFGKPLATPGSVATPAAPAVPDIPASPLPPDVKTLATPDDLNKWAKGKYQSTGFSADERAALKSYQGSGYTPINNALRKGTMPSGSYKKHVEHLDKVMENNKTKEKVLTYRGVRGKDMVDQLKALVGGVFEDKGYLSTSPMPSVANQFSGGSWAKGSAAVMEIILPPGVPTYHFNSLDHGSLYPGENEILLGRNLRLKVTEHFTKNGVDHFRMEVIV